MLKRLFFVFVTFATIVAATAVMAQAYRWVDEDGVVHFSDRPQEGAVRIQLPSDGARPRPVPAARTTTAPAPPEEDVPAAPFRYETLIITAPAPEETLWNIEGVLSVALDLRPGLRPGHKVRVYMNGEERVVSGTSFQLDEVYRGSHNLQAEIINETGQLMIRSLPNRFYVQQNTVAR